MENLKQEYIEKKLQLEKHPERWEKYYQKEIDDVCKIDGYYYVMNKPSIKTRFCFGHGYCGITTEEDQKRAFSMQEKAEKDQEYFKKENLAGFDQKINEIKYFLIDDWETQNKFREEHHLDYCLQFCKPYIANSYYDEAITVGLYFVQEDKKQYMSIVREATKEDLQTILKATEQAKERFTKRLNSYLKRFGLSKIHSWTYLVD